MAFLMLHVIGNAQELDSSELDGAEQIRFEWCHEIGIPPNSKVFTRFMDTLSTLEFSGYTSFPLLVSMLENCPKLKVLHVSTIGFRDYQRDMVNEQKPFTTEIEEFRIRGNGALNMHELHLLKFFYDFVNFEALTSLKLSQGASFLATGEDNEYTDCLPQELLYYWLMKNAQTLKSLEIERSDIIIIPDEHQNVELDYPSNLCNLQLNTFAFRSNAKGFEKVLMEQRNLSHLRLLKSLGHHESKLQVVMDFIFRHSNPLESIHFEHKVTYTLEDMGLGNTSQVELHDCRIYESCDLLRDLHICVSHSHDISDRRRRRPGGIMNTNLLPHSLTKLSLKCDVLSPEEVLQLEQSLLRMEGLELFMLEGNRINPMAVQSSLVRNVIDSHRSLIVLDIKNCQVTDFETLFDYASTPEMRSRLQITPNIVIYRKLASEPEPQVEGPELEAF